MLFLSVPRDWRLEPRIVRFVAQNLIRFTNSSSFDYAAGESVTESRSLDGVGGQVFTHDIEHTFEQMMIQMRQKVLL